MLFSDSLLRKIPARLSHGVPPVGHRVRICPTRRPYIRFSSFLSIIISSRKRIVIIGRTQFILYGDMEIPEDAAYDLRREYVTLGCLFVLTEQLPKD